MKKHLHLLRLFILIAVITGVSTKAFAQLTGTYTIDPAGSGSTNFITFSSAIASLNSQGVGSGGVVFNIASGAVFSEMPLTIDITTSQPTATNTVVFKKSGSSSNPVINCTGTSSATDAVFMLVGTDYITFDGIDINDAGTASTDWTELGFYLVRANANDGCQHVTIENCVFNLDKTNTSSTAIYQRNADASSTTLEAASVSGQHLSNTFDGNTINDCWGGIRLQGSTTIAFPDEDMRVGGINGNTISFGGFSATSSPFGIISGASKNIIIGNNTVTTTSGNAANNTYGIRMLSSFSGHCKVYGNTVSISADVVNFGSVQAIYISPSGTAADSVEIYNNIVENCAINATVDTSEAIFRGIRCGSEFGTLRVYNNIVRNNTQYSNFGTNPPLPCPGINYDGGHNCIAIQVFSNTDSTYTQHIFNNEVSGHQFEQDFIGIASAGENSFVHHNTVTNNTLSVVSTTSDWVLGIYLPTGVNNQSVYDNTIHDLTSLSTTSTTVCGIMGYFIGKQNYNIYNNTIDSLLNNNGVLDGIHINQTGCFVAGSGNAADTAVMNIYNNNVHTLQHKGTNGAVNGIYTRIFTLGRMEVSVYNNFVSALEANPSTNPYGLVGLNFNSGDIDASFNTVYLSGGNTATVGFGSSGIYFSTNVNFIRLRNNLVVNNSSHGTGGKTIALSTNEDAPYTSFASSSDYNSYYAGIQPSSNIFSDSVSNYATLALYQSAIGSGRDANSISTNPVFTAASDPHTNDAAIQDKGIFIASIQNDIDYQLRSNPPDIGADEIVDCSSVALSGTVVNASCFGCADGSVTLNPTGGTAPITFTWNNGATTQTNSNLTSGNYIGCMTDAVGCSVCDTFVVSQPNGMVDQVSDFNTNIFPNPNNGSFTIAFHQPVSGKAEIFNTTGQKIFEQEFDSTKALNVALPQASQQMYILQLTFNETTVRRKIAVQ